MGGRSSYKDFYCSEKKNDTLIITYGRLSQFVRDIDGTDSMILLKIFPISPEAVEAAAGYSKVYFFEEGMKSGGIAEKFLCSLYEYSFRGEYSITAVNGAVGAADIETQLSEAGMDRESIIRKVRNE